MGNLVFPSLPGETYTIAFFPQYQTDKQNATSGREYRVSLQPYAKCEFQIDFDFVRTGKGEMQALIGHFMAVRGSWDSWLFTFEDDCAVTNQLIATGDGTTVAFQLNRTFGPATEPVMNVNTLTNIKVGGVVVNNYTVSDTGLVTFTEPPGVQPITWTGTYYYRCRYTADSQEYDKFAKGYWSVTQLDFTGCLGDMI